MKILFLTNEYPPHIYGGAGVHIDYLSKALSGLCDVEVRCFGGQNVSQPSLSVRGFRAPVETYTAPKALGKVFEAVENCLRFNTENIEADLVHAHTWYTHFGGILAKLNYGIPLVLTVHSLEPLRPWKREQLRGGYDFSCWVEQKALEAADAVIAVSEETRRDIFRHFNVERGKVHVIHNGIDPDEYRPVSDPERLARCGVDPEKPYVLFVGRITRQKGILHLINAIPRMDPGFQIVLCASAPDTPEIGRETEKDVAAVQKQRKGVVWIREMVDVRTKIALYSHAAVFCCPSIYEPFGIINLEAMACETAVVASAVGGIPEVVEDENSGLLVRFEQHTESPFEPLHPEKFEQDLARKINRLMADEALRKRLGKAGRERVVNLFSWKNIAQKTCALYRSLLKAG